MWIVNVAIGIWNILPATVKAGAVGLCEVINAVQQAASRTTL